MRCFLLNSAEQVVHKYDAPNLPAARAEMVRLSKLHRSVYVLAIAQRRATPVVSQPVENVTDEDIS